jgi:3-phenylpropionate/cinnamic acid dioxygenase small subunit
MSTSHIDVDQHTEQAIEQFLRRETILLDKRRFTEWLDVVTDDFTYVVPTPVTHDNPARDPWSDTSVILDETRASLEALWFVRYKPEHFEFAWGENPPQRTRRFVTAYSVTPAETVGEYIVESNLLLTFVRQSDPVTVVPAGRVDTVRETDGGYKLARRVVHIDQTVQTLTHMRLIF